MKTKSMNEIRRIAKNLCDYSDVLTYDVAQELRTWGGTQADNYPVWVAVAQELGDEELIRCLPKARKWARQMDRQVLRSLSSCGII